MENSEQNKIAVKTGLQVFIEKHASNYAGKNCVLVTNHTGTLQDGTPNWKLLVENGINLKALFVPENDYIETIKIIDDYKAENPLSFPESIVIYRFFPETFPPQVISNILKDVDYLIYDIQGIGARFSSYPEMVLFFVQRAIENKVPMLIFDRPAPINGTDIEGNIPDKIGSGEMHLNSLPLLVRYGLTPGELINLINQENLTHKKEQAEIKVIPMENWTRDLWIDSTDLYNAKIPYNLKNSKSILSYLSTYQFKFTNVSFGEGTPHLYQIVAAPWINSHNLAEALNNLELSGISFAPIETTPENASSGGYNKHAGVKCEGVYLNINSKRFFKPVLTGLCIICAIQNMYPELFTIEEEKFDFLWGTDTVRKQIIDGDPIIFITENWDLTAQVFKNLSEKYYLYK